MSDTVDRNDRADRADRLMTVLSGWASVVLFVLGIHRLVSEGTMDWWARAALIFAFGLAIMWVWGYWPEVSGWFRNWVRSGGLNTTLIAIGLIVSLVIVNTLIRRRVPARWDLTKNQRYTLAPQTRSILGKLDKPVHARVFIPSGSRALGKARDLFRQYADASSKFTWERVDSLVNLDQVLAENLQGKLSPDLTGAVLKSGDKREIITDFTEKAVTGAVLKLTRDTVRKVYFLQGHGEYPFEPAGGGSGANSVAGFAELLKNAQWQTDRLSLNGKDAKTPDPADAAAIVIAGPQKEFYPEEYKRLNDYLNKGGSVLLMLRATGPGLTDFLKGWGIATTNGLVLDRTQQAGIVIVEKFEEHPINRDLARVAFPAVRAVQPVSPAVKDVTVTSLIKSGPQSVEVTNIQPGKPIDPSTGKPGPFTVAALAEKTLGRGDSAKKARLAVIGDVTFASDAMLPYRFQLNNLDLASSAVNYVAQEEALVSIPAKDENTEQAFLTPSQGRMIVLLHFLDFPLLALALAILVYLKRR